MAEQWYNSGLKALASGMDWAGDAIHALLVGSTTTADTEIDVDVIADFITLDEFTDGDYARQALAGKTTTQDDGNDLVKLDCDHITFATGGSPSGDQPVGAVVYWKQGTGTHGQDSLNIPLFYLANPTSFTPGGNPVEIIINTAGIARLSHG
jgi:hypothetical protein